MNDFFKLSARGTDVKTEVIAGFTTFLTMAYIVIVNPAILSAAGVPFNQVFIATVISAVVGTLIMALWANYPIAIAPGMGMNAYFVSVVFSEGVTYQAVLGAVFFAGVIFLLLTFTSLRETLIRSIPTPLKVGVASGIGLFIASLGLKMSGIIVPDEETFVTFGDITSPVTLLTVFGVLLSLVLVTREVNGALFIGMLVTAVIGYVTGLLHIDNGFVSTPPSPVFFDLDLSSVFSQSLYSVVFAFLLVTLFDTTGTMIGVAEQAGLMKNGELPGAKKALMADAVATTVGATFGSTPSSAYVESSSGVQVGGRTGLTTLVVAVLFMLTLFFSPIIESISALSAITAPALIIVGSFMMSGLSKVNWSRFDDAFPTFIIILSMPFTSSIATGIALGFITYPLLKIVAGRKNEVHPLIYVFAVLFIIQIGFL